MNFLRHTSPLLRKALFFGYPERRLPESKDLARSSARNPRSLLRMYPRAAAKIRLFLHVIPSESASRGIPDPYMQRLSRCSSGKIGVLRLAQRSLRMTKQASFNVLGLTRGGPREVLRLRSQTRSAQDNRRAGLASLKKFTQSERSEILHFVQDGGTWAGPEPL